MLTYNEFFKIFAENQKDLDLNKLNAYINFVIIQVSNSRVAYKSGFENVSKNEFAEDWRYKL